MNTYLYHCTKGIRLFLALSIISLAQSGWAYTSGDCVRCHAKGGSESKLQISVPDFKSSVHGDKISCQECHTGVVDVKHIKDPDLGTVDCSRCHEQKNLHGMGAGAAIRPQCYSCHTRHNILSSGNAASSVAPAGLQGTCGKCHPRECGNKDYLTWLPSLQISSHKKQDFARAYDRNNCLGCHQGRAAHGEEGQVDQQQCYRCHLSSKGSQGPLMGYIHPVADYAAQPAVFASALIYQMLLAALLIGGFRFYVGRFSRKNNDRKRR